MKALTGSSDVVLLVLPPLIVAAWMVVLLLRDGFGRPKARSGERKGRRIALSLCAFVMGVLALGNYYYMAAHHTDLLSERFAGRSAACGVMLIAASGLILFRKSPR